MDSEILTGSIRETRCSESVTRERIWRVDKGLSRQTSTPMSTLPGPPDAEQLGSIIRCGETAKVRRCSRGFDADSLTGRIGPAGRPAMMVVRAMKMLQERRFFYSFGICTGSACLVFFGILISTELFTI